MTPDTIPFAELGVGVAAISVILFIVKAFLAHLKAKDEKFTETINNHINHSTAAIEKVVASNNRLSETLNRVLDKLAK